MCQEKNWLCVLHIVCNLIQFSALAYLKVLLLKTGQNKVPDLSLAFWFYTKQVPYFNSQQAYNSYC